MLAGIVSSCMIMTLPTLAATTPREPRVVIFRCAPPRLEGSLDRGLIRRVIKAHKNELRACYEKGLQQQPTLTGRVMLRLQVEPSGQVQAVQVSGPQSFAAPFEVLPCLSSAVSAWRFPPYKSERGTVTEISYPIVFRSSEPDAAPPVYTNPYFSAEELAEMDAPTPAERS